MQAAWIRLCVAICAVALAAGLAGCSSGLSLPSYTGGGLPPGDVDLGGVVVTEAVAATDAQAQTTAPVVGAEVVLFRGQREVGRTQTGAGGYFRFENPDTGQYVIEVTPPSGSGLAAARRQFRHRAGRQTFLTITLKPA